MPVKAISVFASQKGGTGKTTLSVQCAASYADANPEEKVLFMDFTELGDGTKRMFGGLEALEGLEKEFGKVFGFLANARKVEEAEEVKDAAAAAGQGLFRRFTGMCGRDATENVKVDDFAVHVSPLNPHAGLPENLYLISSGGSQIDGAEVERKVGMRSHDDRRRICEALRRTLTESKDTWRVFVDTDGDRRPVPLTILGYLLADYCIVPIETDECDFQRVEQMMSILANLREKQEALCQVQLIAWNKVQVYKNEPCEVGHFTPPKVSVDTLWHLRKRLDQMKKNLGDLFAPSFSDVLVRTFPDTVCMPASSNGLAFCRMCAGKVQTRAGNVTFQIKEDQVKICKDGIMQILMKMEHSGAVVEAQSTPPLAQQRTQKQASPNRACQMVGVLAVVVLSLGLRLLG